MSNTLLFRAIIPTAVTGSGGAENLATPDPKEIWTGAGTATISLGASYTVDSLFVGFLGANGSVTASAFGTISAAASSRTSPLRRHAFTRLLSPTSISGLTLTSSAGAVGIVAVGLAWQPTHNREWGSGRQPVDTGVTEPLLGGGFGIGHGARKNAFRCTFGDLLDAEVEALNDIYDNSGTTAPVVVVEDPDATSGLNERIHYGLFDRLEAYERLNPAQTRWGVSVVQWV